MTKTCGMNWFKIVLLLLHLTKNYSDSNLHVCWAFDCGQLSWRANYVRSIFPRIWKYSEKKLAKQRDVIASFKAKLQEAENALADTQESNQTWKNDSSHLWSSVVNPQSKYKGNPNMERKGKRSKCKGQMIRELETKLQKAENDNVDLQTKMVDLPNKHSNSIAFVRCGWTKKVKGEKKVLVQEHQMFLCMKHKSGWTILELNKCETFERIHENEKSSIESDPECVLCRYTGESSQSSTCRDSMQFMKTRPTNKLQLKSQTRSKEVASYVQAVVDSCVATCSQISPN